MIRAIRHTGIVVADLESALRFWCDVMGFRLVSRSEESGEYLEKLLDLKGVSATTVKLSAPDGSLVELLRFSTHPDKPEWIGEPYSTGLTHIAFTVENLDQIYENFKNNGVRFFNKPQYSPDGSVRVVYASGPENLLLELVEPQVQLKTGMK